MKKKTAYDIDSLLGQDSSGTMKTSLQRHVIDGDDDSTDDAGELRKWEKRDLTMVESTSYLFNRRCRQWVPKYPHYWFFLSSIAVNFRADARNFVTESIK